MGGMTLGLGALSSACINVQQPPKAPDPCNVQVVTLDIYADQLINPNQDERPRPVVVKLYQLADDARMLNAKYNNLLLKEAETLEKDVLKVDEFEVFPNDKVEIKFERIPEAAMLAGVAFFHDPQGQSWKTYYVFPPMPDTPEACGATAGEEDAGAPQAFPRTEFFVSERKIDNGGQFDASMFPNATRFRSINLPKRSAASDQYAKKAAPTGQGKAAQ